MNFNISESSTAARLETIGLLRLAKSAAGHHFCLSANVLLLDGFFCADGRSTPPASSPPGLCRTVNENLFRYAFLD
jgi:hypothetical protein